VALIHKISHLIDPDAKTFAIETAAIRSQERTADLDHPTGCHRNIFS
jgi:hypothetical protein